MLRIRPMLTLLSKSSFPIKYITFLIGVIITLNGLCFHVKSLSHRGLETQYLVAQ